MKRNIRRLLIVSTLVVVSVATSQANLVSNGGFETGDLTGWTALGTVEVVSSEMSRDFLDPPLVQAPWDGFWDPTEDDYFAVLSSVGWEGMLSQLSLTFTIPADGWVLEFDYFYDFGDYVPYYDPVVINVQDSSGTFFVITHNDPFIGTVMEDDENIDWTTVSVILPKADTYTLFFEIAEFTQPGEAFESILGVDNVSVAPVPPTFVPIDIKPKTLNLKSKGVFTAFIELPEGYGEGDVDIGTVECEGAPAVNAMMADDNRLIVKFNREELVNVSPGDAVVFTVTGKFTNETPFAGSDTIRVIDKGGKK